MDKLDLSKLSRADQDELRLRLEHRASLHASGSFAQFFRQAWPILEPSTQLVWNWHIEVVCEYLQALWERRLRSNRLIINVPPGTSKSLIVSVAWPAWIWLQDSGQRILSTSNDGVLVTRDTQKMRFLVLSEWYQDRWSDRVAVDPSQREKTLFATNNLGFRQGVPIKGSVTGKRGDIQLIDDPHDAKRAFSEADTAAVLDGYDQGMSSRVNSVQNSLRVLIMQRLRTNDLTGHLLAKKKQTWVHLCIPMEYEGAPTYDPVADLGKEYGYLRDPRTAEGELLDPVRFPRDEVEVLKEDLGDYGTSGQLQQRPSPMSGGILKKNWWKVWGQDKATKGKPLPMLEHVFASWDTAFTEEDLKQNAYSAMTLWGVFWHEELGRDALILLSRWYDRVDYPKLKTKAVQVSKEKLVNPGDAHLIEKKASGISLIQDLRRNPHLRIRGYDPKTDGDKVARAYIVQPLLKSGLVYVPDTQWAEDFVAMVASFPAGGPPTADLTDTTTQALQYLKRKWWVTHPDDDELASGTNDYMPDEDEVPAKRTGTYG